MIQDLISEALALGFEIRFSKYGQVITVTMTDPLSSGTPSYVQIDCASVESAERLIPNMTRKLEDARAKGGF